MTRESIGESFKERTESTRGRRAWERKLDADIAIAAGNTVPVLITGPMQAAVDIVQAITAQQDSPQIVTYDAGARPDIGSVFAEGRQAAARRGSAVLWLREIHQLETRAQRTLASELMSEMAREQRNLRVITSSTASLFDSVAAGSFDARLFYRLNTIHIIVPANHR